MSVIPEVFIEKVVEREDGYSVSLTLKVGGREAKIEIPNLVRKPILVRHEYRDEYLVIKLIDDSGEGIASCCIHKDHIEKGCLDCESLMRKPGE